MSTENTGLRTGARLYPIVGMLFVSLLLISNTIAVKIVSIGGFVLPAGIVCFPITYIFGDVLTEVYGFRRSRLVIWTGFFCLALMSIFYYIATKLPAASFWTDQESFARFFAFVPRIAIASFIAYLAGEYSNSVVLSRMKIWSEGRHLWMRTIGSTIVGEGIDSVIFNFAAFLFVFETKQVWHIAMSGYILKVLYEILATPLTYAIVGFLKRVEGVDHFDRDEKYNILGLD